MQIRGMTCFAAASLNSMEWNHRRSQQPQSQKLLNPTAGPMCCRGLVMRGLVISSDTSASISLEWDENNRNFTSNFTNKTNMVKRMFRFSPTKQLLDGDMMESVTSTADFSLSFRLDKRVPQGGALDPTNTSQNLDE